MSGLCATIKTAVNAKEHKRMRREMTVVTNYITKDMLPADLIGEEAWAIPDYSNSEKIQGFKVETLTMKNKDFDTISFGDSIMDGWTRLEYTAVHRTRNYNIGGSWANHMRAVYRQMIPFLQEQNIQYKNVIIGCLGGNPFLFKQPLKITIEKSLETLVELRQKCPTQRIIVYGIPPVVSIYATERAYPFEQAIYTQWILKDANSAFLPLQKKFTTKGVLPKATMSLDGIHFTPKGVYEFDQLLLKAKELSNNELVERGRIID